MAKALEKLSPTQREEVLSIIENFFQWDDLGNIQHFLFDLQNQVLVNTSQINYSEKAANDIAGSFTVLYNLMKDLKKYQI